jgi:hypothetical protein
MIRKKVKEVSIPKQVSGGFAKVQRLEKWHKVFCWRTKNISINNKIYNIRYNWIWRKGGIVGDNTPFRAINVPGLILRWKWEYSLINPIIEKKIGIEYIPLEEFKF